MSQALATEASSPTQGAGEAPQWAAGVTQAAPLAEEPFAPRSSRGGQTQPVGEALAPPGASASQATQDDEAPLVLPSRSRAPLIGGLVVLALLAAGGIFVATSGEKAPPVAPPQPVVVPPPTPPVVAVVAPVQPPSPATIRLSIRSTPDQAQLFDGETLLGTTPYEGQWDKGRALTLSLKKDGFVAETFTAPADADVSLERVLKPVKKAVAPPPVKIDDNIKDAPY